MLETIAGIQPSDVVDIGIVAALLYAAMSRLRRSQAVLVALGIALLGSLYGGAWLLDLELTTLALQGFFAALVIAVVVLFQEELRQAFEELAAWALGRRDDHRPRLDAAEILVGCLADLAREKVGALIVIPGIQKLDRRVHGGERLGGALSAALLKSLFDPHSSGHDGAVIVEDRRVERFGVQLPLSRNLQQLAQCGTRHSAALGLSERSDALCLVVSEERGTISAAFNGTLRSELGEHELRSLLNRFYRDRRVLSTPRPLMARVFGTRRREKSVAVLLALALWLAFVAGARPTEQTFEVPLEVSLPEGVEIASLDPSLVSVTLAGARSRFYFFDRRQISVRFRLSTGQPGRVVLSLDRAELHYPEQLELRQIGPERVALSLRAVQSPDQTR